MKQRSWWEGQVHLMALLVVTGSVFLVMSLARPSVFLSTSNFRSMAFQFPEFAFLALAVMLTMLTGGIDLSVVSTALLSAILGILFLEKLVSPGELASASPIWVLFTTAIVLATGFLCGATNGLLITRLRISPILATLGTMQFFSGLAVVLTGGTAIYGLPNALVYLGNGSLGGVPIPLWIFTGMAAFAAVLLYRTPFGMRIYLIGGNPVSARFAGIATDRVLTGCYALSGVLSAAAGLIMVARTNSANADYGASYLLLAILIAILGGVHPAGGFGRISGLVLAVLCLQFLSSGLNMLYFSSFSKDLVWGGLLLVIMALRPLLPLRGRIYEGEHSG